MNTKMLFILSASLVGCVDGSDTPQMAAPTAFPRTCAEAARGVEAVDGHYKLYVDNDPTKPWGAYCADVATQPKEYLPVDNQGANNTSVYRAGGRTTGTDVVTEFDMLRVDPIALTIDPSDRTFAVSHGSLTDMNGQTITSMDLGVAMTCGGGDSFAYVDVSGTPFMLHNQFALGGDPGMIGNADLWSTGKVVEMWADGDCGWIRPTVKQLALSYQ